MIVEGAFPLPPLYGYPDPQIQFLFDNMDTNPRRIPKTVTVDMMVCDLLDLIQEHVWKNTKDLPRKEKKKIRNAFWKIKKNK